VEGTDEFQLTIEVEVGAAHEDRVSLLLGCVFNARDEMGRKAMSLMETAIPFICPCAYVCW
jgi:hypothetical protein